MGHLNVSDRAWVMNATLSFLMLCGGCVYLLIGGDFLVRGALALAQRLAISPVIVGVTVVALGTSAPELLVSVHSALNDHPGIAMGNVVGSNIANVLLVVGVPALIHPLVTTDASIPRQAIFMVIVSIMFVAMCFAGSLGQLDGWLLLGVLVTGLVLTVRGHVAMPGVDSDEAQAQLKRGVGIPSTAAGIAALIALGAIFLPLGAILAVDGAVEVASAWGVSEAAIGSTIVALGTSLPELSTTLIAAFRRSADIALGNVIGSNVLNILAIMGITATIIDVSIPAVFLARDFWVMLLSTVLLAAFVLLKLPLGRAAGMAFCAGYVGYCVAVL